MWGATSFESFGTIYNRMIRIDQSFQHNGRKFKILTCSKYVDTLGPSLCRKCHQMANFAEATDSSFAWSRAKTCMMSLTLCRSPMMSGTKREASQDTEQCNRSNAKRFPPKKYNIHLGVIQNCQHYQERTQSTLILWPSSLPTKRVFWKCWFWDPFSKEQWTINDIFKERTTAAHDPLTPSHPANARENYDISGRPIEIVSKYVHIISAISSLLKSRFP